MKRSALLIASPGRAGSTGFLPGTAKDVERYRSFLISPLGGSWESGEIKTLIDPSRADVFASRDALKIADYAFVLFTGHGCHRGSSTFLEIGGNVEIDSAELLIGAQKQVVILDCCRKVVQPMMVEALLAKADRAGAVLHREDCRKYYDNQITRCGMGVTTMLACSKDELASETADGGYYSVALVDAATEWFNSSNINTRLETDIMAVTTAHDLARKKVQKATGHRQNPDIGYTRSTQQFPFAIIS